ncbi:MAG: DNA-binding transcriptional LysR family regulator [Paracoccaceae bacterium]|jgi:DNA-binding transcriptional LysR family regulator
MKITRRNDLSLRLLEVFGTLMLSQTTVATAEELGISQPSVSLAIKQLEKQLGFELFERERKRMLPTNEARSLFQEIQPLFEQLRSVESRVRDLRGGTVGKLRIMATPPLGHSVVPGALSKFLEGRDGVTVQYDVRRMENVIDAVAIGAADIGLCLGLDTHPSVSVKVVSRDRMVAVMRPDHALAQLAVLRPGDFVARGFIGLDPASKLGSLVQNAFDAAQVPYTPQVEARYCHTAAVLAHSCNKIAIVDRYTAEFLPNMALTYRPFDPAISIGACVVSRPNRPLPRLAAEFEAVFIKALNGQV